jgi:hypothetical protein
VKGKPLAAPWAEMMVRTVAENKGQVLTGMKDFAMGMMLVLPKAEQTVRRKVVYSKFQLEILRD